MGVNGASAPHINGPWAPVTTYHFFCHLPVIGSRNRLWLPSLPLPYKEAPILGLHHPPPCHQWQSLQNLFCKLWRVDYYIVSSYIKLEIIPQWNQESCQRSPWVLANPPCLPFKRDKNVFNFESVKLLSRWTRLHRSVPCYPQLWKATVRIK